MQSSKRVMLLAYELMLRLSNFVAMAALFVIVVLVSINVVARYGFSTSWPWMTEMAQLLLLWLVTIGTVSVMDKYALFYSDFFLEKFFRISQISAVYYINYITLIAFFIVILYYSIPFVGRSWNFEMVYLPMSKGYFYLSIPIWAALMAIVAFKKLVLREQPDGMHAD